MKSTMLWDVSPYSLGNICQHFIGTSLFIFKIEECLIIGRCEVLTEVAVKSSIFWVIIRWKSIHAGILLGLFYFEEGGNMFLRNVGWLSTDQNALYPRRQYSVDFFFYLTILYQQHELYSVELESKCAFINEMGRRMHSCVCWIQRPQSAIIWNLCNSP
jgi:hypothetical protein